MFFFLCAKFSVKRKIHVNLKNKFKKYGGGGGAGVGLRGINMYIVEDNL